MILDTFLTTIGLTKPPPRRKQKRMRTAKGRTRKRRPLTQDQRDYRDAVRICKRLDRGEIKTYTIEEVKRELGI